MENKNHKSDSHSALDAESVASRHDTKNCALATIDSASSAE